MQDHRDYEISLADDVNYMHQALAKAHAAARRGEIPVGALVVWHGPTGNEVIGHGANRREAQSDPTAHAEIVALRQAGRAMGSWRLSDCTLYVTLEPCPMCAGAMVNARLWRLVFGCHDPTAGAVETLFRLADDPRLNHQMHITSGICADAAREALQEFFRVRRAKRR